MDARDTFIFLKAGIQLGVLSNASSKFSDPKWYARVQIQTWVQGGGPYTREIYQPGHMTK